MKIKRFLESEVQGPEGKVDIVNNISTERVDVIKKGIESHLSSIDKIQKELTTFENELSKYTSNSKKSNNQIDDSVLELKLINDSLRNIIEIKLSTVVQKLEHYQTNGSKFIYNK